MCVFQRELDTNKIGCSFSKIDYLAGSIPTDEQGFCIFHSENKLWKAKQNFVSHVDKLITYYEKEPQQKQISLEDIVFTGNLFGLFDNREFKKDIDFNRSLFEEDLLINSSKFNDLNFYSTVFNKTVTFRNLSTGRVTFKNTSFKSKLKFDNINFNKNFLMSKSRLSGGISVVNSTFHFKFFFESTRTNLDNTIQQGIIFRNIHFKDFASLTSVELNQVVAFKGITVDNILAFHETQFNYNTPIPVSHSVDFDNITIEAKGRLEFRGSPDNKMFSKVQDVRFINEEVKGQLLFEYTDFTKLNQATKDRLINAAKYKNAKVIVGVGCIKYYNQTPLKSIEIGDDHQNLVTELCNTFIDYFTKNAGFNLGVQFVSKTKQNIHFFYFSDEIISYQEFEAQLQKSEENMWRLIKIDATNLSAQPPTRDLPQKIINATDTMVNLFSLVLKIGSRIPFGLISKENISDLVNTTVPSNTKSKNGIIINQIVLFGINNSQSLKVKKIG